MANNNPAHVVLTNIRLSYVHLTQPYAYNGSDAKYSAMLLIPKTPADNYNRIQTAIASAAEKGRSKFGAAFPVRPKTSLHDGDGVRSSDGQPFSEECKGNWVITVSSKTQPQIRDRRGQPILDSTELYSGIYAHVGVTFYPYNAPQNKGITAALDTVMKVADGEPFGGPRVSADDDFAAFYQQADQTPPYTQQPYAQQYQPTPQPYTQQAAPQPYAQQAAPQQYQPAPQPYPQQYPQQATPQQYQPAPRDPLTGQLLDEEEPLAVPF